MAEPPGACFHAGAGPGDLPRSLPTVKDTRMPEDLSMSLKKSLMEQGMKLLADPRVMKLMQNEQFVKTMMVAMSMPGKIDGFTKDQAEKFAKKMSLATADEVRDLKRTVRSLEDQVAALKRNTSS